VLRHDNCATGTPHPHLELELRSPDHTTLSRRSHGLDIAIPKRSAGESLHVVRVTAPEGHSGDLVAEERLRTIEARYALTASVAASRRAPVSAPRVLTLSVDSTRRRGGLRWKPSCPGWRATARCGVEAKARRWSRVMDGAEVRLSCQVLAGDLASALPYSSSG
jgi:hypothetical protein